jgi:hypothetical protein
VSRSPGVSQRLILDYLQAHSCGYLTVILRKARTSYTRSRYKGVLRAAHRLEEQGKLDIVPLGYPRYLMLCRPGEAISLPALWPDLHRTLESEAGQYTLVQYVERLLRDLQLAADPLTVSKHQ